MAANSMRFFKCSVEIPYSRGHLGEIWKRPTDVALPRSRFLKLRYLSRNRPFLRVGMSQLFPLLLQNS